MKKYIIFILSAYSLFNMCMEEKAIISNEWNARAYNKICHFPANAFMQCIKANQVPIEKLTILDVGCGTGKIARELAKKAHHVYGIDASNNMIKHAQKNKFNHKISFKQSYAETYLSDTPCDLVIMSFAFNWFANQHEALKCTYKNLKNGGRFIATMHTSNTPEPISLQAARHTVAIINTMYTWLTNKNILDLFGCYYPSDVVLKNMLDGIGFTNVTLKRQSFEITMTEEKIRDFEWAIFSSRPIIQYIPEMAIDYCFNIYIENYLKLAKKTNNGKYKETFVTTFIDAHKKEK